MAAKGFISADQHVSWVNGERIGLLLSPAHNRKQSLEARSWGETTHDMVQLHQRTFRLTFGSLRETLPSPSRDIICINPRRLTPTPLISGNLLYFLLSPGCPGIQRWFRNKLEGIKMPPKKIAISLHQSSHVKITSPANPQSPACSANPALGHSCLL